MIRVNTTRDAYHRVLAGEIGRVDLTGERYWRVVYPAWIGAPFCQAGLQWGLRVLGLPMIGAPLPFYVPSMEWYARLKGAWIGRYGAARPGDYVIFDFVGRGYGTHIEYVERYNSNGTVTTIGFNTSSGNTGSQANGRGVWRRTRSLTQVRGFVRLTYNGTSSSTSTSTTTTTSGPRTLYLGVKGNDVAALQRGLMRVFPAYAGPIRTSGGADGSFGNATDRVVREFQRRSGLERDGKVGPATRTALARVGIRWW